MNSWVLRLARPIGAVSLTIIAVVSYSAIVVRAASLPRVTLNADSIGPRAIEEKTGESVTRDYAQAWRDLADALATNRNASLNDYFTGIAKARLNQRIADQRNSGLRTQYVDHGHKVKALFYSPDGGEMQLVDQAQIEVQVFDGQKLIYSTNSPQKYLVLMTPGADRWYVRSLESIPDGVLKY